MRTRWTILAVCAALLLAAPARAGDDYHDIHTIGVVSVIGSELTVKGIGVTVFGNDAHAEYVGRWNLDATVTQWIAAALSPRFKVKPLAVAPERRLDCDDVLLCVTDAVRQEDVDAFLVVYPFPVDDPLGTNQRLRGLGLYRKAGLFGDAICGMYAMYRVAVIDAKSGSEIDGATARLPTGDFLGRAWPWVKMEDEYWPERGFDALDNARKQTVEERLTRLVEVSLPMALHGVGLMREPQTVDNLSALILGKTPIAYFDRKAAP